jgi:hypothetical protein
MAHSIAQAYKKQKTDELYTPKILVNVILNHVYNWKLVHFHIDYRPLTICCPFDTVDSEFVIAFKKEGWTVKYGHISTGEDFFTHDYGEWDLCISNPPFSRKLEVMQRLNEIGRPWAMVTNMMCLNYHEIIEYFVKYPVELLFVDKRVSFDGNPSSFGSGYICRNFLAHGVEFCHIENNNAKQYFIPSNMYSAEQQMAMYTKPISAKNILKRYKKANIGFRFGETK